MAPEAAKLGIIILAAGKGKRMQSDKPKVLHEIMGKPMLQYVLEVGKRLCPDKIVVVTGYGAEQVHQAFAHEDQVEWVVQEPLLGTGHAVQFAKSHFEGFVGNILVLCGDVPAITSQTLEKLIESHIAAQTSIHLLTAELENPFGYGRIITDQSDHVVEIIEEKDANPDQKKVRLINTGMGIYEASFLLTSVFKLQSNNQQKEYYLTDLVAMAAKEGFKVGHQKTDNVTETSGVNDLEALKRLEDLMKKR
ncbi:MAG: NTP transferase domain-containing protein [Deltaproteobacteria bacterium]|nr:NTP transferase domain-containing protein [Deltaproteobacteria bacterium]